MENWRKILIRAFIVILLINFSLGNEDLKDVPKFRLIAPLDKHTIRKTSSWAWSDPKPDIQSYGIAMTRPPHNMVSTMYYVPSINMNAEYEMEFRFRITRQALKTEAKSIKRMVDGIAIIFCDRMTARIYTTKDPNFRLAGANFLVVSSEQKTFITFKHNAQSTDMHVSYLEMLYAEFEKQIKKPSKKSREQPNKTFCELGKFDVIKIRLKFYANANSMEIEFYDNNKEVWSVCFTVRHINRYINHSFHHVQITGISNIKTHAQVILQDAAQVERKMSFDHRKTVTKDLAATVSKKIETIDKEFDALSGKFNPTNLLAAQQSLLRNSRTFEIFAKDFHDGVLKFQEYILQSTNMVEGEKLDDIQLLKRISDKIKNLEQRQSKIYVQFLQIEGIEDSTTMLSKMNKLYTNLDAKLQKFGALLGTANIEKILKDTEGVIKDLGDFRVDIGPDALKKLRWDFQHKTNKYSYYTTIIVFGLLSWIGICCLYVIWLVFRAKKKNKLSL